MTKRGTPIVEIELGHQPQASIKVCGREAETALLLIQKGSAGVTAFDFPGGPPCRLSAYVHDLRGMGFPIRTEREAHQGGRHARYHLDCPARVILVQRPANAELDG